MEKNASTSEENRDSVIKSTAVVKYCAENPACFAKLSYNTDLKEPPSNWLSPSLISLQQPLSSSSGFSSFNMAHLFPDCVGQVDVVSDAENIKKLLKMPYSKAPISLVVHRVGDTILLDEFDIQKYLLKVAEWDWRWLGSFLYERILSSVKNKGFYLKDMSRDALQQRSLVSKFLYHSITESSPNNNQANDKNKLPYNDTKIKDGPWSSLPEAKPVLPDTKSNHSFVRNVVWTFEDIQMLIGTDMPIFGGSTHPCISLRLRDATKPISVLTGIDYWLDNLMSNVPEVVMCYHLNGIVQKYELIKTEDLPDLEDSKFSPKLIHDVAQNILSFLKSNATKAGHTYWLFKGRDDDFVKLYDLTSLCEDNVNNPFTVPVGILLYRVARNMKQRGSTQLGCIKTLLENCLSLLDAAIYPQISVSAHYMLSDLYIPSNTNPINVVLPEDDVDQYEDNESVVDVDIEFKNEISVGVRDLAVPSTSESLKNQGNPTPLCGTINERCRYALKHCVQSLEFLRKLSQQRDNLNMASSNEPIPMPEKNASSSSSSDYASKEPVPLQDTDDWSLYLRSLLIEKINLILSVLTHDSFINEKYGSVLRQARGVIMHGDNILKSCVYGDCGDSYCFIVRHWPKVSEYKSEMNKTDKDVDNAVELLNLEAKTTDYNIWEPEELNTMEETLRAAVSAYNCAKNLNPNNIESINKRLGNAYNELGVLLMNIASNKEPTSTEFKQLLAESLENLELGLEQFQNVEDSINLSLLLSNIGRLYRLKAHATSVTQEERTFLNKAVDYYKRVLSVLKRRSKDNEGLWDSVNWDLSSTLYNLAILMQDCPWLGDDQETRERNACDALQKALQTCDLESSGARLPLYQFRAANLHHRLASLHHKIYITSDNPNKHKFSLQLSKIHYDKAYDLFHQLEERTDLLKVLLEKIALSDHLFDKSTSTAARKKSFLTALEMAFKAELNDLEENEENLKLLKILEHRVQTLCLSLVKLQKGQDVFKKMYALTLHHEENENVKKLATRLKNQFQKIECLMPK